MLVRGFWNREAQSGNPAIATCRQLPNSSAADRFIEEAKSQAQPIDANNILYSLESSADYDPQPLLASIKTRVFALNFDDDEFNPEMLGILETPMPSVRNGSFRRPTPELDGLNCN
jgi:homoserine O-acetyltransferase